jgi:metal-responsive CopG/Arc/MetJ family transcriptional regulator
MKRVQIYLSEVQLNKLDKEVNATGLSRSEIIRRIIDKQFDNREEVINEPHNKVARRKEK